MRLTITLWSLFALFIAPRVAAQATSTSSPTYDVYTNFTTVDTLRQCERARISWVGGDGPYSLIINVNNKLRTILYSTYDHYFDWMVDLPSGTYFVMKLQNDGQSSPNRAIQLTVQPGSNNCTLYGDTPANANNTSPNSTDATNATSAGSSQQQPAKSKTNVGAIVGGVVGGVVGLAIILGLLLWALSLRRKLKAKEEEETRQNDITPFETSPVATQEAPVAAQQTPVSTQQTPVSTEQTYREASPIPLKQQLLNSDQSQVSSSTYPSTSPLNTHVRGGSGSERFDQSQEEPSPLRTHAPTSPQTSFRQPTQSYDPSSAESQYEEDGGPISMRSVVHPPKYNSVWKD